LLPHLGVPAAGMSTPTPSGLALPRRDKLSQRKAVTEQLADVAYQLQVVLHGVSPLIWRRLLVPGDASVADVHAMVQIAFGWDGSTSPISTPPSTPKSSWPPRRRVTTCSTGFSATTPISRHRARHPHPRRSLANFALFDLVGKKLSPRIRDLGKIGGLLP
jgi:hypothetical protein